MSNPLDAIQARADAATAGPWEEYDANEGTDYAPLWCVANEAFHNPPADEEAEWVGVEVHVGDKEDAEFIAHAREDVPLLAGVIRSVEALHWAQHHNNKPSTCHADGKVYPCPTMVKIREALGA